jgi:hypothetical protein
VARTGDAAALGQLVTGWLTRRQFIPLGIAFIVLALIAALWGKLGDFVLKHRETESTHKGVGARR